MLKISLITAMCFLVAFWAKSQVVTVTSGGKPLEGVELIDKSSFQTIITNMSGQVFLTGLGGAKVIVFFKEGYKIKELTKDELAAVNWTVAMELQSFLTDQLVISGTRWQQSSNSMSHQVVKLGRNEILLQNPQTAADLLGLTSKVFVQKSQQGGGSPMIRGFATNRLLYTLDGVRMNSAIFRSGNIQNVINLDPFATESTEVLFGPGSVIYGSDAIGGVMAFQTLKPQLSSSSKVEVSGNIALRHASANTEKTGHADITVAGKNWSSVSSFSTWDYGHLRQGRNGPHEYIKKVYVERQGEKDQIVSQADSLLQIPSGYKQYNMMQKFRFNLNDQWGFQYGFHYSATTDFGRYDRHTRFRNGLPRYGEWNYGPQKWSMHLFSIDHAGKNVLYDQSAFKIGFQNFEESRIERNLNSIYRTTQKEEVNAFSINLDFNKKWKNQHNLVYGMEFVYNGVNSSGTLTTISTNTAEKGVSRYPKARWTSAALYISDELQMNSIWSLQGGMRYNYYGLDADFSNNLAFIPLPYSEANLGNGSLTGSIGTVLRPNENLVIRGNVGSAFRAPNVDDMGKVFESEAGFLTVPNKDLKAEYAWSADLGVAYAINSFFKVDVSAYYTNLKNALVIRNFELNGQDSFYFNGIMNRVQAIQNAASAFVYGLQAGFEMKLGAGLSLVTDWNFQKGKEELNNGQISPSRHVAPLFGSIRLRYQVRKLILEVNTFHQGERSFEKLPEEERNKPEIYAKDAEGRPFAPSWYTLNFKGSFQVTRFLNINGGVENITNQRYRPYSSGISGAGLNFVTGVRASF